MAALTLLTTREAAALATGCDLCVLSISNEDNDNAFLYGKL